MVCGFANLLNVLCVLKLKKTEKRTKKKECNEFHWMHNAHNVYDRSILIASKVKPNTFLFIIWKFEFFIDNNIIFVASSGSKHEVMFDFFFPFLMSQKQKSRFKSGNWYIHGVPRKIKEKRFYICKYKCFSHLHYSLWPFFSFSQNCVPDEVYSTDTSLNMITGIEIRTCLKLNNCRNFLGISTNQRNLNFSQ